MKKAKSFMILGISIVVCFSILFSAGAVFTVSKISQKLTEFLKVPESYEDIYPIVKKATRNDYTIFLEDDMLIEDYATGNLAKSESATATDSVTEQSGSDDYSDTNIQVDGVDEADIVKTDGKYIYRLSTNKSTLKIIKVGKNPVLESSTILENNEHNLSNEMYLYKDYLVITYHSYSDTGETVIVIYNVSDVKNPCKTYEFKQKGNYETSRMIDGKLFFITNYTILNSDIVRSKPETYVPSVVCNDETKVFRAKDIRISEEIENANYTVVCSYDVKSGKVISTKATLCRINTVYCSNQNLIVAAYNENDTDIYRYSILQDGKVEFESDGKIKGYLLNQFSIDEYKDNFRFVTTVNDENEVVNGFVTSVTSSQTNALYVLDEDLKQIGKIENIAPDERVYSVRFMGDTAYFVTFRQVDPLFSVDLSNPKKPKIIGALKIPGFSDYLFPFGDNKLFGIGQDADEKTGRTGNVKISMFDISAPANVTEEAKEILFSNDSESLFTHKATFINKNKNIIGFPMTDYSYDTTSYYMIYSYENGKFVQKAKVDFGKTFENIRGLYIGEEFYLVSDNTLCVYDINDFSKVAEIKI